MYGHVISGSDFAKKIREKDPVCMIAQFLCSTELPEYSLATGKDFMRHKYLERAEKLIKKLDEFGLQIAPKKDEIEDSENLSF